MTHEVVDMSRHPPEESIPYLDFDPIKWVDRLRDVNDVAMFSDGEKEIIERGLRRIEEELRGRT